MVNTQRETESIITHTHSNGTACKYIFRRLYQTCSPFNILILINVFFHFYFTCADDVLPLRCSSFVFVFVAFVMIEYICALPSISHPFWFIQFLYRVLSTCYGVILFNKSLIIKYRQVFMFDTALWLPIFLVFGQSASELGTI